MKQLAILGSTGSIGRQCLAVVDALAPRFAAVALAAGGNLARRRPYEPLLSTAFLVLAGFAKASANIATAAVLIAGGGLIAAKDMLRKR